MHQACSHSQQHHVALAAIALVVNASAWADEGEADQPTESPTITAEQILANPLEESAYALQDRCLATARYRRIEIVGDMALAFHGRGDDVWLNVLPRRCPGLRPNMVLVLEQSSLRICARDRFRGVASGNFEMRTSTCTLGSFERMTPEHLDAMRDALIAQRNTKTIARTVRGAEPSAGEREGPAPRDNAEAGGDGG